MPAKQAAARAKALGGPAAGPRQVQELLRQRRSELRLGGVVNRKDPLDVRLAERWALRTQGELTLLSLEDATVTNPRAAVGLVFRAGAK